MKTLDSFIELTQKRIEKLFHYYLKELPSAAPQLKEAMHYSVFNGGKRLRPLLVYLIGAAFDVEYEDLDPAAAAIELIHAYSLVHDDLPAMDNSDLRRGKPSCHKKYSDAIAILAGDALQTLAFQVLANHPAPNLTAEKRIKQISILSKASGLNGIAGGQILDLNGVQSLPDLLRMYHLKTGSLLNASFELAAACRNENETNSVTFRKLKKFTDTIGLAFQIQDDLMDAHTETNIMGKPQGLDAINDKKTFLTLCGIEKTKNIIKNLYADAIEVINSLGKNANVFNELAEYLIVRKN